MDISAAVMILLMCSGSSADCMEIRSDRTYETTAICREQLPRVVARMNRDGRTVSGRCAAAVDEERPELDPIITCSTPRDGEPRTATVRVTRMIQGEPVTEEQVVPRQNRGSCG
jgi:hypothetical protein